MRRSWIKSHKSSTTTLDHLWSQVVLAECGPLCVMGCGRSSVHAHHVLQRALYPAIAVKYEPCFGVGVCSDCHIVLDDDPDAVEKVLNRLQHVDLTRYQIIVRMIGHEREMALGLLDRDRTPVEQRAYLRTRLKATQHNWMDHEVDLAPNARHRC